MRIIIPKRVKDNIEEIYNYIAKDSLKYAKITVRNIYSRIYELKTSPYLGRYPLLEKINFIYNLF